MPKFVMIKRRMCPIRTVATVTMTKIIAFCCRRVSASRHHSHENICVRRQFALKMKTKKKILHFIESRRTIDPTDWDTIKIRTWLNWSIEKFSLDPKPVFDRFPKTGAELVALSRAEFWVCAGSKRSGNILARFIVDWTHKACGRWLQNLRSEIDPSKLAASYRFNGDLIESAQCSGGG